ncbi:MAG: prepilin-type N-terminal cleavage/methylation domain-containing protein [Pseudomonadales bacterium]
MSKLQQGFTLIELMIVTAITGTLAALAWPAYTDYIVRSRIAEGLFLTADIKLEVSEVVDGTSLTALAVSWNSAGGASSKFVSSIVINGGTGVVTVVFNEVNIGGGLPAGSTLAFTPNRLVNGVPDTLAESFKVPNAPRMTTWACASTTNTWATSKNLKVIANGTIDPKWVPAECR